MNVNVMIQLLASSAEGQMLKVEQSLTKFVHWDWPILFTSDIDFLPGPKIINKVIT